MSLDVEKFVSELHTYLSKALRPIGVRLDDVERRLEAAEAAPLESLGERLSAIERRLDEKK